MRRLLVALAAAALACGRAPNVPVIEDDAGAACVTDQDCNPAPTISALYGQCRDGVCSCKTGQVQPNGKCGPALPPD